jgi:hypothetical protein
MKLNWCKLFGHRWKISIVTKKILVPQHSPKIHEKAFHQRVCKRCGKTQLGISRPQNSIKWTDYTISNKIIKFK